MPNRSGRAVADIRPFKPTINAPEGLIEVARADNRDSEALFSAGADLAKVFSHAADTAAKVEGDRQGSIDGTDPNWRPQGDTTIRGQAYEKAATATYLDTLDAKMRSGMVDAYQAHKDNPAALKDAFGKLQQDLMANDTFPEIRGQVAASFQRAAIPFQVKAMDRLQERQDDAARAASFKAGVAQEAYAVQALESSPYDPKTRQVVKETLAQREAAERKLVDSGQMTAEQAAKNKVARERDFAVREFGASVSKIKTLDELDRVNENYKKQKAEGGLGAIGADKLAMDQAEALLDQRRQQLAIEAKRLSVSADKASDNLLKRVQAGYNPSQEEVASLRQAMSQAPDGPAQVDRFDRRLTWSRGAQAKGPGYVEQVARDLRQQAGGTPSPGVADDLMYLDGLAQEFRRAVVEDPIGRARKAGIISVPALPLDKPDVLAAAMQERTAAANALPSGINPNGRILEPGEIKDISLQVQKGGDGALATIEALVKGAGKDAPRVMKELGKDAPEFAQAGLILASGGSRQAARDAIAGVVNRELDGGAKPMEVDAKTWRKVWVEKTGDALIYQPNDSLRIEATARAIAQVRMRGMADNKDASAQEIMRQAIDEAVGGQKINGDVYGGMAKVKPGYWSTYKTPVPPDVKNDRFMSVLREIRDGDLEKLSNKPADGFRASVLGQAVPVPVAGGYRFAMGEPKGDDPKFIPDTSGKPFVLKWDEIAPTLRQRVPGAFRGG